MNIKKTNYVCFCLFTLFIHSSPADSKCSASNNVKWNKNKRKCVPCSHCPPGFTRNLTEEYTGTKGPHGDEQCLRCRPCPDGFFSENGQGECYKCRMNCTELYREYDDFCSSVQDAKCGSCLSGYEDTYRHTLFPCSPRKSPRDSLPRAKQSLGNTRAKEKATAHPIDTSKQRVDGPSNGLSAEVISVICITVIGAIVTGLVTSIYIRKRGRTGRHLAMRTTAPSQQGSYDRVRINDLSCDDDLEQDAAHSEDYIPMRLDNTVVRSELETAAFPFVRPEISQPASSQPPDGIRFLRLSGGNDVVCYKREDFCNCRTNRTCRCESYRFPSHILGKSDEYILVVASKICHDPFPLFQSLELDAPIIYQENDTRDRAPQQVTQQELVLRLLNRWIEVAPCPTTLQRLSKALCEADFHIINDVIYNLYINKDNIIDS